MSWRHEALISLTWDSDSRRKCEVEEVGRVGDGCTYNIDTSIPGDGDDRVDGSEINACTSKHISIWTNKMTSSKSERQMVQRLTDNTHSGGLWVVGGVEEDGLWENWTELV